MVAVLARLGLETDRLEPHRVGARERALLDLEIPLGHQRVRFPDVVDAVKLGDRIDRVVDTEVAIAIVVTAVASAVANDQERGRLHPARVSPRSLPRLDGRHQPVAEHPLGGLECRRHLPDRGLADEDVPLRREVRSRDPAGPGHALLAGEGDASSFGVDDADLPPLPKRVGCQERLDRLGGRLSSGKKVEPAGTERRVPKGLGGDGADLGARPGDDGADGEELGLHDHAEIAGLRIEPDAGEGGDRARMGARAGRDGKRRGMGGGCERQEIEDRREPLHLWTPFQARRWIGTCGVGPIVSPRPDRRNGESSGQFTGRRPRLRDRLGMDAEIYLCKYLTKQITKSYDALVACSPAGSGRRRRQRFSNRRNPSMKTIDILAAVLLVVGGLNWGLVAVANFDLVALLSGAGGFGAKNTFSAAIYLLVGLAALYQAFAWKAIRARWGRAVT